jgi:hypothetical protein
VDTRRRDDFLKENVNKPIRSRKSPKPMAEAFSTTIAHCGTRSHSAASCDGKCGDSPLTIATDMGTYVI